MKCIAKVKIVQATSLSLLEKRINEFLTTLNNAYSADVKVSFEVGTYYAVILYSQLGGDQE